MIEYVNSILKNYHREHELPGDYKALQTHSIPVLTRYIKPMIEERGMVDLIKLHETEYKSDKILAMVKKREEQVVAYGGMQNIADVYFQKHLNKCWRRFVVCKEMYHCMIDRTDAQRVSTIETLHKLVEFLSEDTSAVLGTFPPLESEQAAEVLALETLFPLEYRLQLLPEFTDGNLSAVEIANMFRIPEFYISFCFQKSYLQTMQELRRPLLF